MLYASLKAVHLLATIVWIGGMFFMLHCLRPAASLLEPPLRLALLHATMRRFFVAVLAAIVVNYALGAAWLATFVGVEKAMALGVLPFLLGDALKLALVTALAEAGLSRLRRGLAG